MDSLIAPKTKATRIGNKYSQIVWAKCVREQSYKKMSSAEVGGNVAGFGLSGKRWSEVEWEKVKPQFTPIDPGTKQKFEIPSKNCAVVFITIVTDDRKILCNELPRKPKTNVVVNVKGQVQTALKSNPLALDPASAEDLFSLSHDSTLQNEGAGGTVIRAPKLPDDIINDLSSGSSSESDTAEVIRAPKLPDCNIDGSSSGSPSKRDTAEEHSTEECISRRKSTEKKKEKITQDDMAEAQFEVLQLQKEKLRLQTEKLIVQIDNIKLQNQKLTKELNI